MREQAYQLGESSILAGLTIWVLQSPVIKVMLRDTANVGYIRLARDRKALVQEIFLEASLYGISTVKQDQDSEELGAFRRYNLLCLRQGWLFLD